MLFRQVYPVAFLMGLICVLSTGSLADESQPMEPLTKVSGPEEQLQEFRSQIIQIDRQMAVLKDEDKGLSLQLRTIQREQLDVRKRVLEVDEESQKMVQQLDTMQHELHALQEALSKRMTDNPDYAAGLARQAAVIERSGAIQKETMELANDRVRIQLELQALERQQAELAEDAAPEPEDAATPPSAEDSD